MAENEVPIKISVDNKDALSKVNIMKLRFSDLGKYVSKALPVAAFAAVAVGIGKITASVAKTADNFQALSEITDQSVESLSTLDYIAQQSNTSLEAAAKGAQILSRNIYEAANGSKMAQDAFRSLGVQYKNNDGSLRSMNAVMDDVAQKFSEMENGSAKTALAMKVMGRSGAELIPMFNSGAAQLKQFREEARYFGLEISTKTAVASDALGDRMNTISKIGTGLARIMAAEIIPWVAELSKRFIDAIKPGGDFAGMFSLIQSSAKWAGRVISGLTIITVGYYGAAALVVNDFKKTLSLATSGEFKAAYENMKQSQTNMTDHIKKTWNDLTNALTGKTPFDVLGDSSNKNKNRINADMDDMLKRQEAFTAAMSGQMMGMVTGIAVALAQGTASWSQSLSSFLVWMIQETAKNVLIFQQIFNALSKTIVVALSNPFVAIFAIAGMMAAVSALASSAKTTQMTPTAMADGGIVTSPTLALVGEAGPEAVIPLDKAGMGGAMEVNVYLDGNSILKHVGNGVRTGRLNLRTGAVQ